MITQQELRIGNKVSERNNHRIYTVFEITKYGAVVKYWSCGETETIAYEKLMPVPLTAETIEQYGLEKYGAYNYRYISQPVCGNIYLKGCWLDGSCNEWYFTFGQKDKDFYLKIAYVHDLQNKYHAFTGEELIIKIKSPS